MASEDRILKILLQIQSDVSDLTKVSSGIKDLQKTTEDAAKSGFSLGDAFKFAGAEEALRMVVDYVREIPVAFEDAIKQGVEFQSELQQLQIGIAAALRQNMSEVFGSFPEAMRASGEIIDLLKAKANELGLSYQQQFEAYQHSVNAMLGGGVTDVQKQIDLIITLNAAIKTLGLSASVTARDINDMLIGNASRTIAGRQLAAGMGFPDATELDKAITQARALGTEYKFFTQHMQGFQEAIQAQATTFNASMQRMQNALLEFKGEMAKPIMEPLTAAIESFAGAASDESIKAFARTLGDIAAGAIAATKAIVGMTSWIGSLAENASALTAIIPTLQGFSQLGSIGAGLFDQNVQQIQAENLQKQYDLLHKQVLEAASKADQEKVSISLGEAIAQVQDKIFSGQIKNVDAAKSFLDNVKWLQEAFTLIAGTAAQVTPHLQEQSAWLEAIQKIQGQIALSNAEAGGDTAAIASARWQQAYDAAVKLLTPLAQTKEQEGEIYTLAQQVADAIYAQVTAQHARKDSQSELKDMLSQESLLLQDIRHQQEEISQNPFLSADTKATLLNQAYQQERTELEQNISKLQEYIAQEKQVGSPEAQAKVTELIAKLHALGFTLDELKFKIQETTFGGQMQADLAKWVNSFGTSAQMIATTIKGTINAALQSTNQLLLDAAFRTGNWQQTVIGLERNILNLFLTLLEQMALKEAASLLGITTTQAASTASGAVTAAAWAPASASVNTATYGASALEGGAITIAEIAAIEGAIGVAHEGEIVGGARPPGALSSKNERIYKLLVGEGVFTEEQMAHMFVQPQATHKFSTDQLEALGRLGPPRRYHEGDQIDWPPEYYGHWAPNPTNFSAPGIEPTPIPGTGGEPPPAPAVPLSALGGPPAINYGADPAAVNLLTQLTPPGTTLTFDTSGQPFYYNAQTGDYTPASQFVDLSSVVPGGQMPDSGSPSIEIRPGGEPTVETPTAPGGVAWTDPGSPAAAGPNAPHDVLDTSGVTITPYTGGFNYGGTPGQFVNPGIMAGLEQQSALDWLGGGSGSPMSEPEGINERAALNRARTGWDPSQHQDAFSRALGVRPVGPLRFYDPGMMTASGGGNAPGGGGGTVESGNAGALASGQAAIDMANAYFALMGPGQAVAPSPGSWAALHPDEYKALLSPALLEAYNQYHGVGSPFTAGAGGSHGTDIMPASGIPFFTPTAQAHFTGKYHSGGELAHDEVPLIGQIGEFIHQKSAVDYYTPELMHALNERRIPVDHLRFHAGDLVGSPGGERGIGPISQADSAQKIHIALLDDHRQVKKWMESREGQKLILRVAEQLTRQ